MGTTTAVLRVIVGDRILGIICLALASPARLPGTNWFLFVVIISFIATAIWSFVYLLSIREAINFPINWVLTEFCNTLLITVLYTVAFIVQLSAWSRPYQSYYKNPNIAAGVFGIINAAVYGTGVYLIFNDWKKSRTVPNCFMYSCISYNNGNEIVNKYYTIFIKTIEYQNMGSLRDMKN
ncbi:hypothetical protein AGLY_007683 [Aphis glycines]|uniref:MARVEL domain-containing protein n=1 Tax=Aphis glycines TaxID=307491 RepID=A0A6G0TMQ5_APHGL|nr:hypothetical protein AGLY_007683 [Aphis glycines]